MFKISLGKKIVVLTTIFMIALAALYTYLRFSADREQVQGSLARIEVYTQYQLLQDGKVVLDFAPDTTVGKGCFINEWALVPSCEGRLVGNIDSTLWRNHYRGVDARVFLQSKVDSLEKVYQNARWKVDELEYYLHSHHVSDEGYNMISKYASQETLMRDSAKKMIDSLCHIQKGKKLQIVRQQHIVAFYGKSQKAAANKLDNHHFQLQSQKTPEGIKPLSASRAQSLMNLFVAPLAKMPALYLPIDSISSYQGETDSIGCPHGHGLAFDTKGTYYEGRWQHGERDGFGFSIAPKKPLRVGEWQKDIYKGERLVYTSDRIYGIDISKYQHVVGKKKYSIDWNRLRITYLGSISKKTIAGSVNYPITFVYIKSTEGTSLTNPYYKKDYAAARAHGYKVGTYHFFSHLTSGALQARHFLKHSWVKKGDFPPVLDVEPTKEQIKKMGGAAVMFSHIRTWLKMVQRETGVKPVLYISQTFVNRYLSQAPDLKHNYQVWIARYGEYKPDIRLIYWQLCPDGKVAGIHGDVDINVFNGYSDAYDQFVSQYAK